MVRAGPLHGQGRGFESLIVHQPSLSGAGLRLGEPNPKGKAVAPKRNARRRTKRKERGGPSLSGAELRLGEPNPKGKAVAPKRNARRRTKREERE